MLRTIERLIPAPGPPTLCPYLPHRLMRTQGFVLDAVQPGLYHALMDMNVRRCGTVFYRPLCDLCRECRQIRVPVERFRPDRGQRRCLKHNRDLEIEIGPAVPTPDRHELYTRYLQRRHDRQMGSSWSDFCEFLYDSPMDTREVACRLGGRLVSAAILDLDAQAASTVYCYFDPDLSHRSLGSFNILWTIDYCRGQGIPYLYLGYYIRECDKMNYKARYRPCEILTERGTWESCPQRCTPQCGESEK